MELEPIPNRVHYRDLQAGRSYIVRYTTHTGMVKHFHAIQFISTDEHLEQIIEESDDFLYQDSITLENANSIKLAVERNEDRDPPIVIIINNNGNQSNNVRMRRMDFCFDEIFNLDWTDRDGDDNPRESGNKCFEYVFPSHNDSEIRMNDSICFYQYPEDAKIMNNLEYLIVQKALSLKDENGRIKFGDGTPPIIPHEEYEAHRATLPRRSPEGKKSGGSTRRKIVKNNKKKSKGKKKTMRRRN